MTDEQKDLLRIIREGHYNLDRSPTVILKELSEMIGCLADAIESMKPLNERLGAECQTCGKPMPMKELRYRENRLVCFECAYSSKEVA